MVVEIMITCFWIFTGYNRVRAIEQISVSIIRLHMDACSIKVCNIATAVWIAGIKNIAVLRGAGPR
jgi:hypothetical protein